MKKFTLFFMSLFLTIGAMAEDPNIMEVNTSHIYSIQFANRGLIYYKADGGENLYYENNQVDENILKTNYQFTFTDAGTDISGRKLYYISPKGADGYYAYNKNTSNGDGSANSVGLTNDTNVKEEKGKWYIFDNGTYQFIVPAWKEEDGNYTRGGCCWNAWSTPDTSNYLGMWGRGTSDPNFAGDNQLLIRNITRLNFDTAYAQAAELLEKAEATYEKIQLTTTEGEDGYIWTNAQSAAEGPIAHLIDGSEDYVNSYFHTAWGSETITPNPGYHFFEIDLGEGNSLSDFAFDYTTRKSKDGATPLAGMPNVVEIYGSNGNAPADATSYSLIAKITDGLPSGQWNQGIKYESENILVNDSYRHIRIRMNNGNSFFMAAEFNIYNAVYDAKYNSLRELYKVHKNNSSYDTESLENATNAINKAINAILYPPFTLNVTGAGYSTLYLDYPAEIPTFAGEDAGAYIITGVKEGNWLELVKVEGVLPANQGIVVKADEGNYTFNYSTATTANVEGNLLRGTVVDEEIEKAETNSYYVLANEDGIGFYNPVLGDDTSKFKNSANKAYLVISKDMTQSTSLRFDFGGTTAIEEITEQRAESKVIFDLTGRRVEAVTVPGVYIVNGKKVLVK